MRIGKLLASVNNKKDAYYNSQLKAIGLSRGQAFVINVINSYGVIQQDELTKNLEIDKSAVTRILKTLEKNDYIQRRISCRDHRIYEIYLTERGQKISPVVNEIIENASTVLCHGMSEAEKEQLVELLLKIKENLENYDEK